MTLKQVRHLIYALFAACMLMVVLLAFTKSMVFLWLTLAFAVAGVAVNLKLWRCPHCGQHLGRGVPTYCPRCGEYLDGLR